MRCSTSPPSPRDGGTPATARGQPHLVTDPLGCDHPRLDPPGAPRVTDAAGAVWASAYGALGNLTTATDRPVRRKYAYDLTGRPTVTAPPARCQRQPTTVGRLAAVTDARWHHLLRVRPSTNSRPSPTGGCDRELPVRPGRQPDDHRPAWQKWDTRYDRSASAEPNGSDGCRPPTATTARPGGCRSPVRLAPPPSRPWMRWVDPPPSRQGRSPPRCATLRGD